MGLLVAGQRELAQQYRSALRWERYKAAVVRNDEKIERLLEQVVNARS